jgi:cysteinyl-tRNA synthetase
MSMKFLGDQLDIHCGGTDHIDVHHTNEIAQSEAATGKPFFNFWMHGAFLIIAGGKKMAKSEGNFLTLDSAFVRKGIDPLVYRFAAFLTHYRKPMEYSDDSVAAAANGLAHVRHQLRGLIATAGAEPAPVDDAFTSRFLAAVNDDLNMPRALAVLQELLKSPLKDAHKVATALDFDRVLGMNLENVGVSEALPEDVVRLVEKRKKARSDKNWALSDEIRSRLQSMGYEVQDTHDGMKVFKA